MDKGDLPMEMLLLMEGLSLVQLEQGFVLELDPWTSCGGDGELCPPPQQHVEANMTCKIQSLYSGSVLG